MTLKKLVLISRWDDPHNSSILGIARRRNIHVRHLRLGLASSDYVIDSHGFGLQVHCDGITFDLQSSDTPDVLFLPLVVKRRNIVEDVSSSFSAREWNAVFDSMFMQSWARWPNRWLIKPGADVMQNQKLFLMHRAVGIATTLAIPDTNIGTKIDSMHLDRRTVAKAINSWQEISSGRYFNTTELSEQQMAELSDKGLQTPGMVQEFIEHRVEFRVYVVRGVCIAVRIEPEIPPIDFRLLKPADSTSVHIVDRLPSGVDSDLVAICAALRLDFCCFDVSVENESGHPYLTDINPTGSWHYLNRDFGVDVTELILDNMENND
ncbi:hypothetical protein [Antrihabitans spumae]|uniref:ATP-grasp domain-containing protein n=1 Tax=Antrihabitans spumae TaxID=3373370 RepID=A0ABW7KD86_9NOCA